MNWMAFLFTLFSSLKHAYSNHKMYLVNKNLLCHASKYIQIYSFYRFCVTQSLEILSLLFDFYYSSVNEVLQPVTTNSSKYIKLESWKYRNNCHAFETNTILPTYGSQKLTFLTSCICAKERSFVPVVWLFPADTDVFKTSSGRLKKVTTSYDQTRRRHDVWKMTSDLRRLDVWFTLSWRRPI